MCLNVHSMVLLVLFGNTILAGIGMLFWQRIIGATNFGVLSWPFAPLEYIAPMKYNPNVRFVYGVVLWIFAAVPIAVVYWILVETSILRGYSVGTSITYSFFLWIITVLIVFKALRLGFAGHEAGRWVWLESLVAWLLFGVIFGLLIT